MNGPPIEASTTLVGGGDTDSTAEGGDRVAKIGTALGRYVVVGEIGQGGMGSVVRAYDPKLMREVAIKEVHRSVLSEATSGRLVAEARAMARVSHPSVVSVCDVEELEGGRLALVMEYVPGTNLRDWLRSEPRAWRAVVERFVAAGRGCRLLMRRVCCTGTSSRQTSSFVMMAR